MANTPDPVEWQIQERTPGDPWSAELVVWSGNAIDGVVVPIDDALLDATAELSRRRADLTGWDTSGQPTPSAAGPNTPDTDQTDPEPSRAQALLNGLGRTTGANAADRWLSGVPVKFQIIGGVALLAILVLVMLLGSWR